MQTAQFSTALLLLLAGAHLLGVAFIECTSLTSSGCTVKCDLDQFACPELMDHK